VLSRQPIEMSYQWGLARQVACFLQHYRSRRDITTGSRWSQFSEQSRFRTIIKLDSSLSPFFLFPPTSGIQTFVTGNWKRGEQIPCPSANQSRFHIYIYKTFYMYIMFASLEAEIWRGSRLGDIREKQISSLLFKTNEISRSYQI